MESMPNPHGEDERRVLPDPDICRTSAIGDIEFFATCHVDWPFSCRYAMNYGAGYFCKHPNWKEFVKE
jgi:hypothetical protein